MKTSIVLAFTKSHIVNLLLIAGMLLLTIACSEDEDTDNNSGALTGYLVDSPVVGVTYQTTTQSGTTGPGGEFRYMPGENVNFSIGDVDLRTARGSAMITMIDLAHATSTNDDTVINLARFLQTLDDNPFDDVITIDDATVEALTGLTHPNVNFGINSFSFESSPPITEILATIGKPMVNYFDAKAHLDDQLNRLQSIVGTWVTGFGSNTSVFIARDDNTYLYAECCDNPELERGTYYYQPASNNFDPGQITFNFEMDQVPSSGIDNRNQNSITVDTMLSSNNTGLSLVLPANTINFAKLLTFSSSTPITGTWGESAYDSASLYIFTTTGVYFGLHDTNMEIPNFSNQLDGIEYGSYSLNSGNLFLNIIEDTSGNSGLAGNFTTWNRANRSNSGNLIVQSNNNQCLSLPLFTGFQSTLTITTSCF